MEHHPASEAFPMMDGQRYAELKADIEANGLLEAITLFDGLILDGRNRYRACRELGLDPRFRQHEGDPWAYVWSLNGQRRDLAAEQRYLIWKKCHENSQAWQKEQRRIEAQANRKRSEAAKAQHEVSKPWAGEKMVREQVVPAPDNTPRPGKTAKAAQARVNRGAVARGDKLDKERPDLADKVRSGELKAAAAHRIMRQEAVAGKVQALPQGQFTVIYADPPWQYADGRTGDDVTATGALHHYPTMTLSELKALDVASLAAPDSVLFLWITSPLLPDGLELAAAWGFKYKASFVWHKIRHNFGHYNSVRHEFLLVCTRGSCVPQTRKLFESVQSIERTAKHSEKPEEFRAIIETMYPQGGKIELFRRGAAPAGWEVWGNEAEDCS